LHKGKEPRWEELIRKTKGTKKPKFERKHADANIIPEKEKMATDIKPGQEIDLDATTNEKIIFEKFLVKCIFLE
jgi:hypothetical protein